MDTMGTRFRAERVRLGFETPELLATRLACGPKTIRKIEYGEGTLPDLVSLRVLVHLGMNLRYVVFGDADPASEAMRARVNRLRPEVRAMLGPLPPPPAFDDEDD